MFPRNVIYASDKKTKIKKEGKISGLSTVKTKGT